MDKKGFTLVELLAVIVILGTIMVIAGTAGMKIKKNANIEEAKKIEQSLTDLGPGIYSYELLKGTKNNLNYFYPKYESLSSESFLYLSLDELANKDYLKDVENGKIKSPFGGDETCDGYLEVKKTTAGPKFKGYLKCGNNYETSDYSVITDFANLTD